MPKKKPTPPNGGVNALPTLISVQKAANVVHVSRKTLLSHLRKAEGLTTSPSGRYYTTREWLMRLYPEAFAAPPTPDADAVWSVQEKARAEGRIAALEKTVARLMTELEASRNPTGGTTW
jgi:hypothetical protein